MDTFAEPPPAPARKLRGTFLDQPAAPVQPQPASAASYAAPVAPAVGAPVHLQYAAPTVTVAPVVPQYRARKPLNLRMFLFAAVVICLLGWPIYTFVHEMVTQGVSNRGDRLAVDLKALGNFNMPPDGSVNDVPARYRALDGKRVELEGKMYAPMNAGPRGTEFQFVYDVAKCCFAGPPQAQERVYAYAPKGSTVEIYDQTTPARIVGILHVNVEKADGKVVKVYTLDVQKSEQL